jgi:protein-S-isoprenylcysteine O-methyltransferase Ste14
MPTALRRAQIRPRLGVSLIMGTDLQPSHCMDTDRSAAESQNASARATGALDETTTKLETTAGSGQARLVSRDLTVRLIEQVVFVTAVIGAVSLGMGITAYFAEHRYIAAYLLAYIGFRFANLLVGEDLETAPAAYGFSERVLNELPVLILFAAAPFERTYIWGGEGPAWLSALGLLLALAGLWLALGSRIQLHFFSSDPSGRERMLLVKTGFFKYIRHPVYAGVMLVLFAWPLVYGAPMVTVLTLIIGGVIARSQILADERVLRARFGEEFEEYCRTTDALIPSIW